MTVYSPIMVKKEDIRILPNSEFPPISTVFNAVETPGAGSSDTHQPMQKYLQGAKRIRSPDLSQIVEQKTWENNQLRQELEYQKRKHSASLYLLEEVKPVVQSLRQALINFERLNGEVEKEMG